jgi:hypothetical protein
MPPTYFSGHGGLEISIFHLFSHRLDAASQPIALIINFLRASNFRQLTASLRGGRALLPESQ